MSDSTAERLQCLVFSILDSRASQTPLQTNFLGNGASQSKIERKEIPGLVGELFVVFMADQSAAGWSELEKVDMF